MSGPVTAPLRMQTNDGSVDGIPINTIKVTNGDLSISGAVASLDTSGGGGGAFSFDLAGDAGSTQTVNNGATMTLQGGSSGADLKFTMSASNTATLDLQNTTVTPGSYQLASITVDAKGRITAASSGSAPVDGSGASTQVTYWQDSDTITGSSNMTFDGTNLSVSGYVKGGNVRIGDGTGEIETDDANDLVFKTNTGTNSGTLTLKNGTDGNLIFDPSGTGLLQIEGTTNPGSIKLMCEAGTHGITIQSPPHSANATYTFKMPTSMGTDGQVLTTDGADQTSWTSVSGGTNPAGSDREIQFNDNGSFGAVSAFKIGSSNTIGIGTNPSSAYSLKASSNIQSLGAVWGSSHVGTNGGSATQPTYKFNTNNTGLFFSAVDQIDLTMGGTNHLSFGSAGEILVGGSTSGTSGQVLTSGGSGSAVSWTTISAGSPGGSDTQVQFNDGGSFGGDSGMTFNKTGNNLSVSGSTTSNSTIIGYNPGEIGTSTATDVQLLPYYGISGGKIVIPYTNNSNITITPGGTGKVEFNGAYTFPNSDGSANQVLQTDGAGSLSFATVSGGGSSNTDSFGFKMESGGSNPRVPLANAMAGSITNSGMNAYYAQGALFTVLENKTLDKAWIYINSLTDSAPAGVKVGIYELPSNTLDVTAITGTLIATAEWPTADFDTTTGTTGYKSDSWVAASGQSLTLDNTKYYACMVSNWANNQQSSTSYNILAWATGSLPNIAGSQGNVGTSSGFQAWINGTTDPSATLSINASGGVTKPAVWSQFS